MASTLATMLNCSFSGCPEYDIVMVSCPVQSAGPDDLLLSERKSCANLQPPRLREFAAGRKAARLALAHLGLEAAEIPRTPQRYPLWPEGVFGSISHTHDIAVATVSMDKRLAGIGIDIENPFVSGGRDIARYLLADREQEVLERLRGQDRERHLAKISCCKEAAYKALYPITHDEFDFPDIEVELVPGTNAYRIADASGIRSAKPRFMGHGRTGTVHGKLISLFVVEAKNGRRKARCRRVDDRSHEMPELLLDSIIT